MSRQLDPAGLVEFVLPPGFGPDLTQSTLEHLAFRHFRQPDEMLTIQVMPTTATPSAEAWFDGVRDHSRGFEWRLVSPRPGSPPYALGERLTDEHSQRVHLIRGARFDVALTHRTTQAVAPGTASTTLREMARRLQVPAHHGEPRRVEKSEAVEAIEAARAALWARNRGEALAAATRASVLSTHVLVASLHQGLVPEIPAACIAVEALIGIGQVTYDLLVFRAAEALATRSLNTLETLTFIPSNRRRQFGSQLIEMFDVVGSFQGELEPERAELFGSRDLRSRANARGSAAHEHAERLFEQRREDAALRFAEASLEDLATRFAAVASASASSRLPPDTISRLGVANLSPEAQFEVYRQLNLRYADQELKQRGFLLFALLEDQDPERALAVAALLVSVARRLARREVAGPAIVEPEAGYQTTLATALIMEAAARERLGDDETFARTAKQLEEAEALLDEVDEERDVRAWLCLAMAYNRHARRVVAGSVAIIDRGLRACDSASEPDKFRRELLTIRSQFLMHEGRHEESAASSARARALGAEEERPHARAAYDLNAALIAARAGASKEALELLHSALQMAFEGDPTEEVALRILHVAATMLTSEAPELAAELDSAALTIVEERRDAIADDRHRVVFGEATRWHEIHDRLVAHYAARSATQALEIIDRMRGRSLHRDRQPPAPLGVSGPNLDDNPLAAAVPDLLPNVVEEFDATVPKPTFDDRDPRDAFRAAARYLLVDAATRRILAGEPKHLSGAEIERAALGRGATILMIHPLPDRTLLLTTQGPGRSAARWVDVPRAELVAAAERCWRGLGVRAGARGQVATDDAESTLDGALEEMNALLIEPIVDELGDRPLIIVPYRELALLPFWLLPGLEQTSVSLVPCVAVLGVEPSAPARPKSAYVVGDPATHKRWLMPRLPGARREAAEVEVQLRDAGVDTVLRTDTEATRASFFAEAAGRSIVHLACHGELGAPGDAPRLLLAEDERSDGALLEPEIPSVRLDGALVFLSACETGQGWPTTDGVVGMGRAFLRAGAAAVVVSLWRAHDLVTRRIAGHFYEGLLRPNAPLSAADALRRAMLETREALAAQQITTNDGEALDASPTHWAPFFLLGENICYAEVER